MAWSRAGSTLVLVGLACASSTSTFDTRLGQGDVDGVLAAFQAEDVRRRPDAVLQVALLLRERGAPGDAASARELLAELVREHPEAPEARTARGLLRLDSELSATRDSIAALLTRVASLEGNAAQWSTRARQLQMDMALSDSLVSLLTRTAARLENELEAERRELEQLRRTLEQLMEVDVGPPPVPGAPEPPPTEEPR